MNDDDLKQDGGAGPKAAAAPSLSARILHRLRNYMIAGILVTAPIGLTLWLSWLIVTWIDDRVMPLVPFKYHPEAYLPFSIPGFGLIVVLVGLVLIGAFTANLLGRTFLRISERVLERMPIMRGIHATFKQVFETILSHQSDAFRQVVLVEYPRRGIWALGFLTGETLGEVQNLTKENSSMGWGLFYWVVNVGAVMAPVLATIILGIPHSAEGWRNLFLASAVYTCVNLLVLLTFKDVPSGADKTMSKVSSPSRSASSSTVRVMVLGLAS